jgi:iron-sulfur cluster assembly protein
MPIEVTETAQKQVRQILQSQSKHGWGVRVGVKGGGCSGLSYVMDIAEKAEEKDKVFDYEGFQVFCDPKSYFYLNGLSLDFSTDLMGGGFRFNNPNATKTCGCGTSFAA